MIPRGIKFVLFGEFLTLVWLVCKIRNDWIKLICRSLMGNDIGLGSLANLYWITFYKNVKTIIFFSWLSDDKVLSQVPFYSDL